MSCCLGTIMQAQRWRGLGIIDMKNQNTTLLMKFLDKFYNHPDIPWVKLTWSKLYQNTNIPPHERSPTGSFWWRDIIKLFEKFKAFAICHPNPRNSVGLVRYWKINILISFLMPWKQTARFSFSTTIRPADASSNPCQYKLHSNTVSSSNSS